MFWFILFGILAAVGMIGIIVLKIIGPWGIEISEIVGVWIGFPLLAFFASLCFMILSSGICSCFCNTEYKMTNDKPIIALQDNIETNGRFFLGSGTIDEDPVYYYMAEDEFGYKMDTVDTDFAYIQYSKDKPHIETYAPYFTNGFVEFFTGGCISGNRTIIYVPKGSIVENYNVDLQ
jgi:hypothetical protein